MFRLAVFALLLFLLVDVVLVFRLRSERTRERKLAMQRHPSSQEPLWKRDGWSSKEEWAAFYDLGDQWPSG